MPKYDIDVKIVGHNGNAFSIIGAVTTAMRKAKIDKPEIDAYVKRAMAGSYEDLLVATMETVNVK
jgi:hypothetical protein